MSNNILSLNNLEIGQKGKVEKLLSKGNERRRMLDLGLIKGTTVEAIQKSPSGDPIAYSIRGAVIAIRDQDAQKVLVSCN